MISTTTILIVLVVLFLVGIKLIVDLVRAWPRKKLSSYTQGRRSGRSHR